MPEISSGSTNTVSIGVLVILTSRDHHEPCFPRKSPSQTAGQRSIRSKPPFLWRPYQPWRSPPFRSARRATTPTVPFVFPLLR